jgi:hypothetical protein
LAGRPPEAEPAEALASYLRFCAAMKREQAQRRIGS